MYGRKFKLVTDHRPLLAIFGQNTQISQFSANRLRRWAVILSNYQYEIEYVPSNKNVADCLSRLPCKESGSNVSDTEVDYACYFSNSLELKIDFKNVQLETAKDTLLQKVLKYERNGWPNSCNDIEVKPYFSRRFEFSESDNCLFWNHRIIIPFSLQENVLQELHSTHQGVVKMKSLDRAYFRWPGLDKSIEVLTKQCKLCNKFLLKYL